MISAFFSNYFLPYYISMCFATQKAVDYTEKGILFSSLVNESIWGVHTQTSEGSKIKTKQNESLKINSWI